MVVLSFTPFCREQAERAHCQFSCWPHVFTSFCRAPDYMYMYMYLLMHSCLARIFSGGVVVYWSIHSTLTLRARVRISPSPCTFVLQQGNLFTLLLSTQVYNWGPGRMWQMIVFEFASAIITGCYTRQGMLPGEGNLCTVRAALKCIQWPG